MATTPSYTIDPKKQTVSGQLTGLLEQDSPYMQQAKTAGEQYATSRGLLNSSIGAQASQDAAIQAAMPIAQADANTYNTFAGKQYDTELQKNVNEQLQGYEQDNMRLSNTLQKDLNTQMQGFEQSNMRLGNELQMGLNSQMQGFEQANMNLASSIEQSRMQLANALEQGNMQLANTLQQQLNSQQQAFQQDNMKLADEIQQTQMELENALRQGDMVLANELQQQLNAQQNQYDNQMMTREQAFAATQNDLQRESQMDLAQVELASQREMEALKQQSLMYAQFTKGVADINAADMTGAEKDAAVQSLWEQFTQGSDIANTLRYIEINDDGSVTRLEGSETTSGTSSGTTTDPNTQNYTVSYVYGDGGMYMPGVTTDSSGNLVNRYGETAPANVAPTYSSTGTNYSLVGGEWQAQTVPKLQYDWGDVSP